MAKPKELTAAKRRNLAELTRGFRSIVLFLFGISGLINILALTGSLYMMQIYDRALTSGSVPTLVVLSALAVGLYLFQGGFDVVRSQILVRVGARLDKKIAPMAHRVAIDMPRFGFSTSESLERGRDVDTVRGFLGSQGPGALFDLPWMPVYLVFIYLLHPLLGALTFAGAFVLIVLTVISEILTKRLHSSTRKAAIARNTIADSNTRNAEVIKAMGFAGRAVERFNDANGEHLELQTKANDISGTFAAISRVLRMLLQSAVLGLGAYLTIMNELTAGAIIACSVASARALAPVDLAIGNWKGFVAARAAYDRLRETVTALAGAEQPMKLPPPQHGLLVDKITVAAPGTGQIVLSEIGFELLPGQALGIIGPSAGGKTTLVRALTGIWPVLRGSVRLDGADLAQWHEDEIGQHIGYLPQEIGLMDATIEENISRFEPEPDYRKVIEATKAAGVHEMILKMPEGYRTKLGPQGMALSAGQRQRVALARALYGNPFLVIMDEPNSNLDGEGEEALTRAIEGIKARAGIAIVIAHRPSALVAVDLVAIVQNGRMTAFGKKEEIMTPSQPSVRPAAATLMPQNSATRMIKVQALKDSERRPQPSHEDYVFEEKPKSSFGPLAFLTVLTGFAVYLKSFFSAANEAPPDQQKSRTQNTEDDSMAAQGSAEGGPSTDAAPPDEPQKDAAGDSDKVVPMTARRAVTQDAVDSFLASNSPPLAFGPPKPGPAPRLDQGFAANDNQSAAKPLSSGEKDEIGKMGHGGGGSGEEDVGVLLRRGVEPQEIGQEIGDVVIFSGRPLDQPVDKRPRDDGGPADRNRLPRTNGPVVLPDLIGCQAYFIPVLALLAGASDADGDQLKVVALSSTSGTLVPVEGGWIFTPDRDGVRDLVFKYAISDGTGTVQQRAHLRIVDAPPIVGTDGDDNLLGTACGDVIDARDGHDNIDARQGDDVIIAGDGDDHILAGAGNDIVFAGAGNDIVFAGAGNDIVYGGVGNDRLFGEDGDDTIFGEQGDDLISGGTGDDVLLAGAGNDTVHGDAGNDMLDGGAGDDSLHGGDDDDKILGELGDDFIAGGMGDDVVLAGAGNDTVHGDAGNDVLDGGEGDDSLQGGDGNDTIFADAGDDTVLGDDGEDVLSDGQGSDTVDGGAGDDLVNAAADGASDDYDGGTGEDTLDYSSAILDIFVDVGDGTAESAEIGRDFIAGFEKIIGGQGDDHFVGGSGPISMAGGDGDDTFEFKASDDDYQPDLVRKITDFTYGDRIIAARYEIFYRNEDGVEAAAVTDLFKDIYLSGNTDQRPIRFRFEQLEKGAFTFVEVHDGANSDQFYSIELAGRHDLEFTVVVS